MPNPETISNRHSHNPLEIELANQKARLNVFQAVRGDGDIYEAFKEYNDNRYLIVPLSVTIWAQRTAKLNEDREEAVERAIANEVVVRFKKDLMIAKAYANEENTAQGKETLEDLITTTDKRIRSLTESLKIN